MKHKSYGFTIVELIITIVVIGILASISVVIYQGLREQAQSTAVISQSREIIKGLKIWESKERAVPTTSSCITPKNYTNATCPSAFWWGVDVSNDQTFQNKLLSYSGLSDFKNSPYGDNAPLGSSWYHSNYFGHNRSVYSYFVGPNSDCGLPDVLSGPGPGELSLEGADYTNRNSNRTVCMIEVSKW